MKKFLLIAALGMAVACGGSKGAEQTDGADAVKEKPADESTTDAPEAGAETAAENVLPNDGTRQIGDVTKCPVSGDVFKISADAPTVEHNGGTYYFCCKGCVEKFSADPEKFLSGAQDATPAEGAPEDAAPADAAPTEG